MSSELIHRQKYEGFRADAEVHAQFVPTRIEAYFQASFHLIETVTARQNIHIDLHGRIRRILEANPDLFDAHTEAVWRAFQRLENNIRPGQVYGGAINGPRLREGNNCFIR
jgi:hypothetical protein